MDSLPTPRRRRTTSPSGPPSSEAMDSLRLPPLRFVMNQKSPGELNCVLPPITPPPRLSPLTNTPWQHSPAIPSALPSPSTISPGTDVASFSRPHNPEDARLSPITHTPPSTIRPLPPPSVIPAAGSLPAHSNISTSSQYAPVQGHAAYSDAYPAYPTPGQLSVPQHAASEPYSRTYQNYGLMTASPVAPWRQGPSLPGPAQLTGSIQRSEAAYSEIVQVPLQVARQALPHGQVIEATAEPARAFKGVGGYYNDGTPIQRVGPIDQQALVLAGGGSLGAGSSTQPQLPQLQVKSPLKKTVNTARGIRDVYACPYPNCTRVSTEQSNMKAHMRMHTGEKPYVCRNPGCMKAFRWKSSLTYHEKALHVKSRPFKCSPCRRSFVEKRKLRMHFDLCPVIRRHREQGDRGDGGPMQ